MQKKAFILLMIAFMTISFAAGAATTFYLTTAPTIDGQTVTWNSSESAWQPSSGVIFPLAGSTICFNTTCDQNIVYVGGDLIING